MAGRVGKCAACSHFGTLEFRIDPDTREYRWLCENCAPASSRWRAKQIDAEQVDRLRSEHEQRLSSGSFRVAAPNPDSMVLVVEDDADLRTTLGDILEDNGYSTARASTGQQALDMLRITSPSVILLDLMMPIMNGWEFIERADRDRLLGAIPVVVMASFRDDVHVGRFRVLRKPIAFDALLDAVRTASPPS
jgi:CheY-like chemotaxis protein